MIDLNRKATPKPDKAQPEEILCGILAVAIWVIIMVGWIGAC